MYCHKSLVRIEKNTFCNEIPFTNHSSYKQLNYFSGDIMLDGLAGSGGVVGGGMAAGGVVTGSGGNVVDMLEIPGKGIY